MGEALIGQNEIKVASLAPESEDLSQKTVAELAQLIKEARRKKEVISRMLTEAVASGENLADSLPEFKRQTQILDTQISQALQLIGELPQTQELKALTEQLQAKIKAAIDSNNPEDGVMEVLWDLEDNLQQRISGSTVVDEKKRRETRRRVRELLTAGYAEFTLLDWQMAMVSIDYDTEAGLLEVTVHDKTEEQIILRSWKASTDTVS